MFDWIRSLFRIPIRRADFEQGMSEELRFHSDEYIAELVRSGVSLPRPRPAPALNSAALTA